MEQRRYITWQQDLLVTIVRDLFHEPELRSVVEVAATMYGFWRGLSNSLDEPLKLSLQEVQFRISVDLTYFRCFIIVYIVLIQLTAAIRQ